MLIALCKSLLEMWNNLILPCANALITWWHCLSVSKEHNCWRLAINNSSADVWSSISGPFNSANIYKRFKVNIKVGWLWYSGSGQPTGCFWSLRELSRISLNGLALSQRRFIKKSRCLHVSTTLCVPACNYCAEKVARQRLSGVPYASLAAICDACLLKGFIYHKAAGRWLGKLGRNASGSLGWILFCVFLY